MRLSEAISLGSLIAEPEFGTLIVYRDSGPKACALGMAGLATGAQMKKDVPGEPAFHIFGVHLEGTPSHIEDRYEFVSELWPWTAGQAPQKFPCGCEYEGEDFGDVVIHIFDNHVESGEWSLQQLVDWVGSVEPAEGLSQSEVEDSELTFEPQDIT